MGQPAATSGAAVVGTDIHIVLVPSPGGPVPTPLPHVFSGTISGGVSTDVTIMGRPAATVGSTADNLPPHLPTPPGTLFQRWPTNRATVQTGSATVRINGQPAARNGDIAMTCNDPVDMPNGTIVAAGTVLVG
jgi:uncharacterized Zn-binding protein involved in type VI secretion